jgi:hypothetical protein
VDEGVHGPFKRRQCGAVQAAPRPLRCEAADSNDGFTQASWWAEFRALAGFEHFGYQ